MRLSLRQGQFGPGRVLPVTVPAGNFATVQIGVIDFIDPGNQSAAH
ncbi:MAG: hypothetical protein ACLPH3_02570 [Terracidiphilus sp.]